MKKLITLTLFISLAACTQISKKISAKHDAKKGAGVNVDIDDALLGTWVQTGMKCSEGEMTPLGTESAAAFRIGMAAAKAVVTSDKTFWDMKEYHDVESPNNFCQVSVEEKWTTKGPDTLIVSNSETLVTGNGDIVCDKKYKYDHPRTHKYKATENELEVHLSSTHDALTGVSSSDKPFCKKGDVVLTFKRDEADE